MWGAVWVYGAELQLALGGYQGGHLILGHGDAFALTHRKSRTRFSIASQGVLLEDRAVFTDGRYQPVQSSLSCFGLGSGFGSGLALGER
jgi:hypothetical protein